MVETVIGCKWSLTVMELVRQGVRRPGAMERSVEGLTAKVLGDCLRLLLRYGILTKQSFAEIPPRVEYSFTTFGLKFLGILESLDVLEAELQSLHAKTDSDHDAEQGDAPNNHSRHVS